MESCPVGEQARVKMEVDEPRADIHEKLVFVVAYELEPPPCHGFLHRQRLREERRPAGSEVCREGVGVEATQLRSHRLCPVRRLLLDALLLESRQELLDVLIDRSFQLLLELLQLFLQSLQRKTPEIVPAVLGICRLVQIGEHGLHGGFDGGLKLVNRPVRL